MRSSNANNTILFEEKRKEFENNKNNNEKDNKVILETKNSKIISLSTYKRLKFKNHIKKDTLSNVGKTKKRIFLIVILALFLLIFATTAMKEKSYGQASSNTFVAQNYKITQTETSTYKTIITKAVNKYTNTNYNVNVSNLHQNGNLIYAQGYFDVPEEGKVNYDMILRDNSPTSLTINGNEYIK